ncbi:MAG: hypothetical protein HY216_04225 [Candidatus Rokubacteria bacterium]|nr:hypothetical protein [Candidatus Rokubacteria bacterium]
MVEMRHPLVAAAIGGLTFAITANAASTVLMEWIGRSWTIFLGILATAVVVAAAAPLRRLLRILGAKAGATPLEIGGVVPGHRGLIVLASEGGGISSAEGAIRHHVAGRRLEHCWIITGSPRSEASATDLIQRLAKDDVPVTLFNRLPLDPAEANDPVAVYRRINDVYLETSRRGVAEDDIMADYTGGTKSMTAGMVLACTSPKRHLQFMKPRRYTSEGLADHSAGSDPVAIDIRFELIQP